MKAYDPATHPRPSVAVDIVLFTIAPAEEPEGAEQLQVMLIRRQLPPFEGAWALPGGFVRIEESLEEAARRELAEETSVQVRYLEQLYTFGAVDRDPARRAISVTYFALVDSTTMHPEAGTDALKVSFFPVEELPELAFDHLQIIEMALSRLRYKTEYAPVAFQLLPDRFTLSELQRVYQIILNRPLDKRNFRRKVLSLKILEDCQEARREGPGRPAQLFRFHSDGFQDLGGGIVLSF